MGEEAGDEGGWRAGMFGVQRLSYLAIRAEQSKVRIQPDLPHGGIDVHVKYCNAGNLAMAHMEVYSRSIRF